MDILKSVADLIKTEKDPLIKLNEILMNAIDDAVRESNTREKPSSMLSVFRIENDKWRSLTRRLQSTIGVDGTRYENDFIERLSASFPEIYTVCVHNRTFIGHTPRPEQMVIMSRAEQTLKTDLQPRLALTIYRKTM